MLKQLLILSVSLLKESVIEASVYISCLKGRMKNEEQETKLKKKRRKDVEMEFACVRFVDLVSLA